MYVITIEEVKSCRDGFVEIARRYSVGESPAILLQTLDYQRQDQLRYDDVVTSCVATCTTKRTNKLAALKAGRVRCSLLENSCPRN